MAHQDAKPAKQLIVLARTPLEEGERPETNEALQQMYWACRLGTGFPGKIPDESTGVVPTDAILHGLGLMVPDPQDFTVLEPRMQYETPEKEDTLMNGQLITPPAQSDATQEEHATASRPSLSILPSTCDQMSSTSPSLHSPLMSELELDQSMDTGTLQMQALPQISPSMPNTSASPLVAPNYNEHIAPSIDIDFILDTSCCTVPTSVQLPESLTDVTGWEACFFQPRKAYFLEQLNLQEALHDSCQNPWPGSLAAVYQSVSLD
ncbi:hypothetical protein LTR69_011289 [Exophiala sideris]|uniref:Uncharacterized protein n=1 Tax=Exophiala sideris TaxID=1016849 RepID=A0ABR0IV48_9EURO|nr:hypothetical protein LTR69_011289 [Exophiala sideris]